MKRWPLILGVALASVGLLGMVVTALLVPGVLIGTGDFDSLGERIFVTGVGEEGPIPRRTVFVHHHLASRGCANCHGPDGRGDIVLPGGGNAIETPEITYQALTSTHMEDGRRTPGWTEGQIAEAIRRGVEPDGERLSRVMPRWDMSEAEMEALIQHLKTLDQ